MIKFEKVTQYADIDLPMPERKTELSSGYDIAVAEDTLIPPYRDLLAAMRTNVKTGKTYSLEEVEALTKKLNTRPTLVPTGMKCKIPDNCTLELAIRSSSPLKYWLILANGIGEIDADYYGNSANDGHIYFQVINLSPFPIQLKKGDIIGQGIVRKYEKNRDKATNTKRVGGFGSTNNSIPDVMNATIEYQPSLSTKEDINYLTSVLESAT